MTMKIGCAPCCWGVDDVRNPHLPPWRRVLSEASQAGYSGIELGPYGYLPLEADVVRAELDARGLSITAGTIFDDLVSPENLPSLLRQTREICALIRQLPPLPTQAGQRYPAPYLVVMDWGHPERDYAAGHPDRAPRLSDAQWAGMVEHIRQIAEVARDAFGVRAVIHPHAGGYLEFDDEIDRIVADIPAEAAGLCLDTGHLYYSGMDPASWLCRHAARLDYVHFKDIDLPTYRQVLGERIAFFDACARGVMCPIGQGVLDYPAIKRTLEALGYAGYITIEQERDPRNAGSSLRDVAASREFLATVGFA
ncbi:TIM barrel protein [Ralstonia pseudosolanacearum]|uniref:TIM barrel protein n=1 Tax=Ralstonia pseudosolanacearum TaxID=1310165 RepID=UPI001865AC93|nr:TIM barrel protein [Ralstonia pseudosolanacearum]QOK92053.1 TIM barrel protein [Ralstonia pseudosolanacearum]UWD92453.1 sugar phosphate isomerase/epimerase [Ralstonia pseudosolanacearum]CAH0440773.1 Inosose dehydratase [Ralstonia pseudosolanacearum]